MQELWSRVDGYFNDLLVREDNGLLAAVKANRRAGLPAIDVPPTMGKLLALLVQISGARRVLEIGTLGAYSTIWLARAVPDDGMVVTLELDRRHADIAKANLTRASVLNRVDLRIGPAEESLRGLVDAGEAPFDFIFIDADKKSLPEYLEWAIKLARAGTVIVADNVVRDGEVVNSSTTDPHVQGVRRFIELLSGHPRLTGTALQTVCGKGYDGFAIAVVSS